MQPPACWRASLHSGHWNRRPSRISTDVASRSTEEARTAFSPWSVDGIQFSSGCTMGKGNIGLESATDPAVTFEKEGRRLRVALRPGWRERIDREMSKEKEIEQSLFYYTVPESDVFEVREG